MDITFKKILVPTRNVFFTSNIILGNQESLKQSLERETEVSNLKLQITQLEEKLENEKKLRDVTEKRYSEVSVCILIL